MEGHSRRYKELTCKNFGSDCNFMIRAETFEELMRHSLEHACNVHGKCDSSPESMEKIESRIKDVWM